MAALTVQETSAVIGGAVLDTTLNTAAGGGDTVANDGRVMLVVTNGDASPTTLTVAGGTDKRTGQGYDDSAYIIAAGDTAVLGPFHVDVFGATLNLTYSSVTSLTVGVVRAAGCNPARI